MELSGLQSVESKISTLSEIKKSIAIDIYKMVLRCGMDPDFFDYSSFSAPSFLPSPSMLVVLEKRCTQMVAVVKKIEELKNA